MKTKGKSAAAKKSTKKSAAKSGRAGVDWAAAGLKSWATRRANLKAAARAKSAKVAAKKTRAPRMPKAPAVVDAPTTAVA